MAVMGAWPAGLVFTADNRRRLHQRTGIVSLGCPAHDSANCMMEGQGFVLKKITMAWALLAAVPALAQLEPGVRMAPGICAAHGRLGKAMMAHDAAGVRTVWAEDFVVNSPNNQVLEPCGRSPWRSTS